MILTRQQPKQAVSVAWFYLLPSQCHRCAWYFISHTTARTEILCVLYRSWGELWHQCWQLRPKSACVPALGWADETSRSLRARQDNVMVSLPNMTCTQGLKILIQIEKNLERNLQIAGLEFCCGVNGSSRVGTLPAPIRHHHSMSPMSQGGWKI